MPSIMTAIGESNDVSSVRVGLMPRIVIAAAPARSGLLSILTLAE